MRINMAFVIFRRKNLNFKYAKLNICYNLYDIDTRILKIGKHNLICLRLQSLNFDLKVSSI